MFSYMSSYLHGYKLKANRPRKTACLIRRTGCLRGRFRGELQASGGLRQFGRRDRAGPGRAGCGRGHGGARPSACGAARPARPPDPAHQRPAFTPAAATSIVVPTTAALTLMVVATMVTAASAAVTAEQPLQRIQIRACRRQVRMGGFRAEVLSKCGYKMVILNFTLLNL